MQLNYNDTDFKNATFKEINELIEIHNERNAENQEKADYKKEYHNISEFTFL